MKFDNILFFATAFGFLLGKFDTWLYSNVKKFVNKLLRG